MVTVPLQLGPLTAAGFDVRRSGIRWLREDGDVCRPGEIIAFCNVGLVPFAGSQHSPQPFAGETRDLYVAFAPRIAGRLRKSPHSTRGGLLDLLFHFQRWTPDFVIGELECGSEERGSIGGSGDAMRLLFAAGRRVTELAGGAAGLLTGWYNRRRAWWGDGDGTHGSVLGFGICELASIMRGERGVFLDFFEAAAGPSHIAVVPDDIVVPCAAIMMGQLSRTPSERETLAADFIGSFHADARSAQPEDWIFANCLLAALARPTLTEDYDLFTRSGLRRSASFDAVILSLSGEVPVILRHRRLGYAASFHEFRLRETSAPIRAWLTANFEPVKRTIDDIRKDLAALVSALRARSEMKLLFLNNLSTSGYDSIVSYAPFDRPMGDTLVNVRNREMNLMLHDVARDHGVAIVDVDAIAAEVGSGANFPDGTHGSGILQAAVRSEILRILRDFGVRGFEPRQIN